jgi:hypothetical protein
MYGFVYFNYIYKFVLIYDQEIKPRKIPSPKKGTPHEPRYAGMCMFSTKKIETGAGTISFLYQNAQDNHP